nr:hypothetical protein [Tanacetum cinerariifolium]
MGIVPTEMELILEQTQQGISHEVSTINEQLEAKVLTRSSNSSKTSDVVAADLSKLELKKILIDKMESNKSIRRSDEQRNLYKALVDAFECDKIVRDTYGDTVTLKRRRDDADKDKEPSAGSDRGSKRRREGKELESTSALKKKASKTTGKSTEGSKSHQKTASKSVPAEEPMQSTQDLEEPSHQEFETGAADDQSIVEDSQHPECPTYELMKGSSKSLVELEFFLEEVYKATTDQLDGNNPEGHKYPHNLLKPLPLIPNSRGHRVIPSGHFINNDLEYLRGDASSQKYTTSVTKTKATDYGHIKWIEDLFYQFSVNRESARDVYLKRRITAVTKLQIVKWDDYKHLDWITVRRDDDNLYKFKEGDFKRLRIQDIEEMLLLLVQGKPTNLTVEERFAFNVSLRMFTRSIVIQRRVEDLQLGFIYQNKDKQNRLMRIDELHKFCDGTLNDVWTTLDDRLKGIRMKYLPQTIWRRSDKEREAVMIQSIDKQLKTRRIMRSLEKFVRGRLYEGDFRMLQQTIWSILTDSQVNPTKHGQMTKPYSSYRFIANCFNSGHLKMEVKCKDAGIAREWWWKSWGRCGKGGEVAGTWGESVAGLAGEVGSV